MNLNLVIQTGLLMMGLTVIGALGGMSNGIFAEMTVQGFGADLRQFLFRKVQTFSFGNLDELDTGQLITRLTNDVTQVQEAILMILRMLVRAPLLLIGSLVMAIVTSPQLAFLPLVLMPIELAAVMWVINRATPHVHPGAGTVGRPERGHAGKPGRRAGGQSLCARPPRRVPFQAAPTKT